MVEVIKYNGEMVLGRQFHDSFGPEPLKSKAISIINKRADSDKPLLEGADARTVLRAANIRQWPLLDSPSQYRGGYSGEWDETIPSTTTLHTSQKYLHAGGLQDYLAGNEPEFDENYEKPVPYDPELMISNRGDYWIDEGHHRMVASRLRGDPSRRVVVGPLS